MLKSAKVELVLVADDEPVESDDDFAPVGIVAVGTVETDRDVTIVVRSRGVWGVCGSDCLAGGKPPAWLVEFYGRDEAREVYRAIQDMNMARTEIACEVE